MRREDRNGGSMKKYSKVYQTKFGTDEGNCLNACLSSLTGINIDEFDKPLAAGHRLDDTVYFGDLSDFLSENGFRLIVFPYASPTVSVYEDLYVVVIGENLSKTCNHACIAQIRTKVFKDGIPITYIDIVHDPYGKTSLYAKDVLQILFIFKK